MFDLIKRMVDLYGPAGHEKNVADAVEALLRGKVDSIRRDTLGNLICEKKGTALDGKRIMLSAHMDHIGLVVVSAEKEGFLRVMPVGAINLAVSKTRHVSFGNGVQGVVVQQPVREGETPVMKHMFIDIGAADAQEALSMVELGDVAVFSNDCFRLGAHRASAPAMDDRVACALLVAVMEALPACQNTIIAVFTAQEEVGLRGARTAVYSVEPDIGIALDVTGHGDTPETKLPAVTLGEGAAIKIMDQGSISHPDVVRGLLEAGKRAGVKTQREVLPYGATDAAAMQTSRGGVPVGTVSIPCRYVHSACEVIDLRDVEAAKKLLIEYVDGAL
jgi:endoglucanase